MRPIYRALGSLLKAFGVLGGVFLFMGLMSSGFKGGIPLLIAASLGMLWATLWWLWGAYLQSKHQRTPDHAHGAALLLSQADTRVTVHPIKRFIGQVLLMIAGFIGIGILFKAYHVIEHGDRIGRTVVIAGLILLLCWKIGWSLATRPSRPDRTRT